MKKDKNLGEKNCSFYSLEIKKSGREQNCIVFGITLIYAYTSDEIELHTHVGKIVIRGNGLELRVFKDGAVEILGGLKSVSLS